MSDIEIMSQDRWRNDDPETGRVLAGTVYFDVDVDAQPAGQQTQEEMLGEPSVDWSGIDRSVKLAPAKKAPVKRKPRAKKV